MPPAAAVKVVQAHREKPRCLRSSSSLQLRAPPYWQVRFSPNIIRATPTECRKVQRVGIGTVLAHRMASAALLPSTKIHHGTTLVTTLRMSVFILIATELRFSPSHIPGMATSTTSIWDTGAVASGDMTITAAASVGGGSSVQIGTSSTSPFIPTQIAMSPRVKHMDGGIGASSTRNTIHT